MKLNRLYGKALAARCTFSVFSLMRKRSGLNENQPLARQGLSLAAAHQARSTCRKTKADYTKLTACTARILPSATHSARSARRIIKAGCMKLNRLHGKALAVRCSSSYFHPLRKRSGLHEAQPVVRQGSCCPLHIQRVQPAAKPKRTERSSVFAKISIVVEWQWHF